MNFCVSCTSVSGEEILTTTESFDCIPSEKLSCAQALPTENVLHIAAEYMKRKTPNLTFDIVSIAQRKPQISLIATTRKSQKQLLNSSASSAPCKQKKKSGNTSNYFAAGALLTIFANESAFKLAPPISPPSTSGCERSSAELSGFMLPPY